MVTFPVRRELHGLDVASGAITGKAHAEKISALLVGAPDDEVGTRVLFDFTGVSLASASYIKATILWLTSCGRMHAGVIEPAELLSLENTQFVPFNVFPLVASANEEIEIELREVFGGRGLVCAIATELRSGDVRSAKVVGSLESTAIKTLKSINGFKEFTAYDLQDRYPQDAVNATAWNNRLAELHRLRLLRRRKDGKFWKYQSIADQLNYG
jgi:hypothetical protein